MPIHETELRMECLRLAHQSAPSGGDVIKIAQDYYDFVTGPHLKAAE